jgi:hypothetical protein
MGEKGDDHPPTDGSAAAELELMKGKLELMEQVVKDQTSEFRAELASPHVKMQSDMQSQLDEFLNSFMKLNSQTPPPPSKPLDSVASNIAQNTDQQSFYGEKTPPSFPHTHSASPQSFLDITRPTVTQPSRPQLTLPQTAPSLHQFGMPPLYGCQQAPHTPCKTIAYHSNNIHQPKCSSKIGHNPTHQPIFLTTKITYPTHPSHIMLQ